MVAKIAPTVGQSYKAGVRIGDPLPMSKKLVLLSADNQEVDASDSQLIELTSNNTTYTARTFVIPSSTLDGQRLELIFTSGSSMACQLANAGTCRLNGGDWVPTQYDALSLVSYGGYWYEMNRTSVNSEGDSKTSTPTALADDVTVVTTATFRTIYLSSDSATATGRTFTLGAGSYTGQKTTLVWTHATNRGELLPDTTTKITEAWRPGQYDTLTMVYDGTRWIEMARTYGNTAGKVASVALIADNQAVATEGLETIILTSDDATAANRTFTLTASARVGHRLTLIWNDADEGQLADTATIVLVTGAWEPTNLYQNITLISDGTRWIEICRADPT